MRCIPTELGTAHWDSVKTRPTSRIYFLCYALIETSGKKKSIEHHEDKKTKITMMQAEPSFQGCLDTCFEKDYTCDFVLGLNLSTWTCA